MYVLLLNPVYNLCIYVDYASDRGKLVFKVENNKTTNKQPPPPKKKEKKEKKRPT